MESGNGSGSTVVFAAAAAVAIKDHGMEAVQTAAHLSGEKRFTILDATLKRCQFRQDALIEVLHKAQELFGFLERTCCSTSPAA